MTSTALDSAKPEIHDFRLGNGLQVVVIPDRRAPVVTHMVWYRTDRPTIPWANRASPIFSNT